MNSITPVAADKETTNDYSQILESVQWSAPWIQKYIAGQAPRFSWTVDFLKEHSEANKVLEVGANPFCLTVLLDSCFDEVHASGFDESRNGDADFTSLTLANGETLKFPYRVFNAESEPFAYEDCTFDLVVCCEIIEHLTYDPMNMLLEAWRILRPGGQLLVTTPNATSYRALEWMVDGLPPNVDPFYRKLPYNRHNRELSPRQVQTLVKSAGFEEQESGTITFKPRNVKYSWMLEHLKQKEDLSQRGDFIYSLSRKSDGSKTRYPEEESLYRATDFI